MPSISMCGFFCMSSRSLNVPGLGLVGVADEVLVHRRPWAGRTPSCPSGSRRRRGRAGRGLELGETPRASSQRACAAPRSRRGARRRRACQARLVDVLEEECGCSVGSSRGVLDGPSAAVLGRAAARRRSRRGARAQLLGRQQLGAGADLLGERSATSRRRRRAGRRRRRRPTPSARCRRRPGTRSRGPRVGSVGRPSAHRSSSVVGAAQRARDVRADVDAVAADRLACRTCRRTSRPPPGRPGVSRITRPPARSPRASTSRAGLGGVQGRDRRPSGGPGTSPSAPRSPRAARRARRRRRVGDGRGVLVEVDGVVPAGDARAVVEAGDLLARGVGRSARSAVDARRGPGRASPAWRSGRRCRRP